MAGSVLVVDDDKDVLHAARLALGGEFERVDTIREIEGLEGRVIEGRYDVIVLDMNFAVGDQSGREGLALLERLLAADRAVAVVLVTTFGGVDLAVEGLKRGASDFVLKPWRNDKLVTAAIVARERTGSKRRAASTFDLDQVERAEIVRALEHHGHNVSKVAAALGMTRPALYRRMAKHGL